MGAIPVVHTTIFAQNALVILSAAVIRAARQTFALAAAVAELLILAIRILRASSVAVFVVVFLIGVANFAAAGRVDL